MDFVWASNGNYAVRDAFKIKVFKSSDQFLLSIVPDFKLEKLFGGHLLCVKSKDFVVFYDWARARVIRRIDVSPTKIIWSDNGSMVAIITPDGTFLLHYNHEQVEEYLNSNDAAEGDEGFSDAFDVVSELQDTVISGLWIHDCFFYTNAKGKLNYSVGKKVFT